MTHMPLSWRIMVEVEANDLMGKTNQGADSSLERR